MTPEQAIAAALREEFAPAVDVGGIQAMPLAGGVVARRVTRLDVSFVVGDVQQTRRYVLKHTERREAATMRQLRPLAERCALPQLVADGEDADGAWLLLPFIAGRRLAGELLLPADVAKTLARVAKFTGSMPPPDELRAGFLAGTAQINVQYLSYALDHRGEARALAMVKAALAAAEQLR